MVLKLLKDFEIYSREKLTDKDQSWAFLRLYSYEYHNKIDGNNAVKTVIKIFSEMSDHGKTYTHASINYNLEDHFYGLNPAATKNKLKVERISKQTEDDFMYNKNRDHKASFFTVLGVPIKEVENKKLEAFLKTAKEDNNLSYDYLRLVQTGLSGLKEKIHQIREASTEDAESKAISEGTLLAQLKEGFVCSSFCAYALSQVNPEFKKFLTQSKKSVHDYTPTTLTTIPKARILFEGPFSQWTRLRNDFIKKNPEFARFVKNK